MEKTVKSAMFEILDLEIDPQAYSDQTLLLCVCFNHSRPSGHLAPQAKPKWQFEQFKKRLDSEEEDGRGQVVNASLNGIRLAVKEQKS
jgi:hypothetical protein